MIQQEVEASLVLTSLRYFAWVGRYDVLFIWMLPLIVLAANLVLHLYFAGRSGIPLKQFLIHLPVSFAIMTCSTPTIAVALWREMRGQRVVFNPTNEVKPFSAKHLRFRELSGLCWFPIVMSTGCLLLTIMKPWNLVMYANFLWIAIAIVSPYVVWTVHRNVTIS